MGTLVRYAKPRVSYRPGSFNYLDRLFGPTFDWHRPSGYQPAVDVREEEERYVLEADLPGITEKSIQLTIHDNNLTISAGDDDAKEESYLIRERGERKFSRRFSLPKDSDAESIDASYANGVLTVVIAKAPEAKPKMISRSAN